MVIKMTARVKKTKPPSCFSMKKLQKNCLIFSFFTLTYLQKTSNKVRLIKIPSHLKLVVAQLCKISTSEYSHAFVTLCIPTKRGRLNMHQMRRCTTMI